jgi:hypothetical protein
VQRVASRPAKALETVRHRPEQLVEPGERELHPSLNSRRARPYARSHDRRRRCTTRVHARSVRSAWHSGEVGRIRAGSWYTRGTRSRFSGTFWLNHAPSRGLRGYLEMMGLGFESPRRLARL